MDLGLLFLQNDGRLRLSRQGIIFKNSKTGKVDNIQAGELTEGIWRRVALGHGLKLLTKNGHVYKYDGFRESEFEKLSDFFKTHYRLELMEKDLCVKGWNWGTVKFGGQLLSFDIGDQPVFEIPLSNVSQCTTGKNEVTLEFHQNDDAEVSLMEVRFYVPPTQEDGVDPVEVRLPLVALAADGAEQALAGLGAGPAAWLPICAFAGLCPECVVKGGCNPGHGRCHLHLPGAAVSDSSWSL
uniref:FACT complex subunit SSRP1 n=1 Tax=Pan troglodytes TaxID=9598 RepID=G2HHI3_PANTR|nr:FACT complex subunit SSRP1 [Pan troglodytes]